MKKVLVIFTMILAALTISNAKADENIMTGKKVLVTYFSATGTTSGVAKKLAAATGSDLFEIKPEQPYTDADLNWHNEQSRSSLEMKDMSSRPAITDRLEDMNKYDVIFVGFPIWWGREPSIINTFMESYDFAGKTVIPFVTSGSSDIGDCGNNMQSLAPQAKVLKGKRFSKDVSESELKKWADEWL